MTSTLTECGTKGRRPNDRWDNLYRYLGYLTLIMTAIAVIVLLPTGGYAYDEAALLGGPNNWLRYGAPLYHASKFGADLTWLGLIAETVQHLIGSLGILSGVAAIHIAWKLPLMVATALSAKLFDSFARGDGDQTTHPSRRVFILWISSPLAIWVAAVHGQVESLAIASTAGGLYLLRSSRRWRWTIAGFVSGLGVGLEYFPAVVLVGALLITVGTRASWSRLAAAVVGFALGAMSGFFPIWINTNLRNEWIKALMGAARSGAPSVTGPTHSSYGLSVWLIIGRNPSPPMAITIMALLSATIIIVSFWLQRTGVWCASDSALAAAGALMVAAVLLDPVSNYQFALIAQAGLVLLALANKRSVGVPLLLGTSALVGYLLYESPWNFFYDMWGQAGGQLHRIPQNPTLSEVMCRIFVVGALAYVLYVYTFAKPLFRVRDESRRFGTWRLNEKPGAKGLVSVSGLLATCCILELFVLMAVSPPIWSAVGPAGPKDLIDLRGYSPAGSATINGKGEIEATISRELVSVIKLAKDKPTLLLEVSQQPLVAAPIGLPTVMSVNKVLRIDVSGLKRPSSVPMDSYLVQALVFDRNWPNRGSVPPSGSVSAIISGLRLSAKWIDFSSPGWCVVTFMVPQALVHGGRFTIMDPRGFTGWDGVSAVRPSDRLVAKLSDSARKWSPTVSVYAGGGAVSPAPVGLRISYSSVPSASITPVTRVTVVARTFAPTLKLPLVPSTAASVQSVLVKWPSEPRIIPSYLVALSVLWLFALAGGVLWVTGVPRTGLCRPLRRRRE